MASTNGKCQFVVNSNVDEPQNHVEKKMSVMREHRKEEKKLIVIERIQKPKDQPTIL